ncbi:MAG: arginine deiminase-related protein, partial [Dokdonella sp.]
MIVTDPQSFLDAVQSLAPKPDLPATARAAFLVSPVDFALAAESARDNAYMDLDRKPDPLRALAEHAELAHRLSEDVPIVTFPGDPDTNDGVFPNNAFATVAGRLIIGRMRHAVRQRETRRSDIRNWLGPLLGNEVVDLSSQDLVAELTGALVIDRARGIGYCGLSERCNMAG